MNQATRWFEDGEIHFALGIENTFIPQARLGERSLDEYELTQHYHHWYDDLGLVAESGATMLRWGIPWYRVEPEPGVFDFSWTDRVVDRAEELGIELIVDLMHYGTPLWLDNQFLNHEYPQRVAAYGAAVAQRYRGRISAYTPMNEPLLNVMYCGQFGYWPPYLTGDDGFARLARSLAQGIVLTQQAIAAVLPEAVFVHVEASFRFAGDVADYDDEVTHLRHRAFLMEDLVTGKVDRDHPLAPYLLDNGWTEADLGWFLEHTAWPDVMGVNYYPGGQTELFVSGAPVSGGPLDPRSRRDDGVVGLREVMVAWAQRYDRPVMLTETCQQGTDAERAGWLHDSVALLRELRRDGLNVVGYTWWAVIDMVEWTYRHSANPPLAHRLSMGLWSLEEDAAGVLQRHPTPLVSTFRAEARMKRGTP